MFTEEFLPVGISVVRPAAESWEFPRRRSFCSQLPVASQSQKRRAGMVMAGVLLERHPDHIVLSNGARISVREDLLPEGAAFGRSLTITYLVDGDQKRAEDIKLVPDWLLDWMAEHDVPDVETPSPQVSLRSTIKAA
jgi:hypothetical protein